jgi:CBS domain-containing protein
MQVSEIMTRSVELIEPDTTLRDAACRMRDADVGALPVGADDRLIGMVTDRDIAVRGVAMSRAPERTPVREVMSGGVAYCYEDESLEEAARKMAQFKLRRLPVINHDKRLVGMVALGDIARSADGAGRTVIDALASVSEPSEASRRFKSVQA